jgi:hypothetical protein
MPLVDPWTSVRLRAHALNLVANERVFRERERERLAFWRTLESLEIETELGLGLRSPAEEMPWDGAPFGSWRHYFWTSFHAMYPQPWWAQVSRIEDGSLEGIEPALVFLEADPWCFRSGYTKQLLMRLLRRPRLLYAHQMRLRRVCLAAVYAGPRMEFREYCRTARVVDGTEFRLQLSQVSRNADGAAGQRARWMLDALVRTNGE